MPEVEQCRSNCRIAQCVPLLQEVDAQHPRERHQWATATATLRIVRFDQRFQRRPRHDPFHLAEKLFTSRRLLLRGEIQGSKGCLFHRAGSVRQGDAMMPETGNKSEHP